jgi:hypothetical protein
MPSERGVPSTPIVSSEIEGKECFASLRGTLLKMLVEHIFPARRVQVGGVRDHAVKIE